MKKFLVFGILLIITAYGFIFLYYQKAGYETKIDEFIDYAIIVDGKTVNQFPNGGGYNITIECDNAQASWDYVKNAPKFSSISGSSQCDIIFITDSEKENFSNYIVNLSTTNSDIELINTEIRYTGKNPDNYIWFNNEMWRIIGVLDRNSHGNYINENLVKIIRSESLAYSLDTERQATWANSSGLSTLNHLYNNFYYNSIDGTNSAECKKTGVTISGNCDFIIKGLDSEDQNLVALSKWYLGAVPESSSANEAYIAERGNSSSGEVFSFEGEIGLMYSSDYGYASPSSCHDENMSLYNLNNCAAENWLLTNPYEWTITSSNEALTEAYYIHYNGYLLTDTNLTKGYNSRPTLYLNHNVKYISGNGTEANPFIVG